MSKFRIAISGAGIGGLTLAVTIGQHSKIPIDLYEAGPEITTIGAGISIWKRPWEIMKGLGLEAELTENAMPPPKDRKVPGFNFRRSDQPGGGHHFFTQVFPYGVITMHRARLVEILKENLPETCTIHLSKRLTKYTREDASGPITLYFQDGSCAQTDVLIGADGIRSPTRATLFETLAQNSSDPDYRRYIQPTWSGSVAHRCLIPAENVKELYPNHSALFQFMNYCGKNKHIIAYPISQGRWINLLAFCTTEGGEGTVFPDKWVCDVAAEEVQDIYKDWEPEVRNLLKFVDKTSRWAIHVVYGLPRYTDGCVGIIGDAAHAMTTHFGAGASQAIEDAYVLGRIIADDRTQLANIEDALRLYEEIRRPLANDVAMGSRTTGLMCEFSAPGHYDGMNRTAQKESLGKLKVAIEKQWEWQWTQSFDEDWEVIQQRLDGVLGDRTI